MVNVEGLHFCSLCIVNRAPLAEFVDNHISYSNLANETLSGLQVCLIDPDNPRSLIGHQNYVKQVGQRDLDNHEGYRQTDSTLVMKYQWTKSFV